jgi:dipeptidyl aminopeptidase/acylaminoacyl peptidase
MKTPRYESDLNKLVLLDRTTMTFRTITESLDRSVKSFIWSPDSEFIFSIVEDRGHERIIEISVDTGERTELLGKYNNGDLNYVVSDQSDMLLFTQNSPNSPNELFTITIKDKKQTIEQRTFVNARTMTGFLHSEPAEFWYKGSGNDDIMGWFIRPTALTMKKQDRYPMVLLIHGGPESAWNADFSFRCITDT